MGGHVAKKLGDGLMALFGYPVAQENDAERAARAALSIQRALAEVNRKNADATIWSSARFSCSARAAADAARGNVISRRESVRPKGAETPAGQSGERATAPVRRVRVTERTGGVPLFVEEVTRLLLERGEQGGIQAIPPTLQQSLTARLDRLGPVRATCRFQARRRSVPIGRRNSSGAKIGLRSGGSGMSRSA
jgi:hypothetical protein